MTFTGDIGPRVISDGLVFCVDAISDKCEPYNLGASYRSINEIAQNEYGFGSAGGLVRLSDGTKYITFTNAILFDNFYGNIINNHKFTFEVLIKVLQDTPTDIMGFAGYTPYWGYSFRGVDVNGEFSAHLRYQDSSGNWQSNVYSGATVPYETWNHIVITYDGVTAKTYINGELKFSTALNTTGHTDTSSFRIGNTGWNAPGGNSKFGFWRVYEKALTAQEVAHNYIITKRTRGVL